MRGPPARTEDVPKARGRNPWGLPGRSACLPHGTMARPRRGGALVVREDVARLPWGNPILRLWEIRPVKTAENPTSADSLPELGPRDSEAFVRLVALLDGDPHLREVVVAMARRLLPRGHRARRLIDTQDVVQGAMCTAVESIDHFRGRTRAELMAWMRAILRTEVTRVTRSKDSRFVEARDSEWSGLQARTRAASPLDHLIAREDRETLLLALRRLPDSHREVVELRLRGLETAEICRVLRLAPAAVRKRESRAKARLKAEICGTFRRRTRIDG